jgi:hypothetical protein
MTEIVTRLVWKQDSISVTSPPVTVRTHTPNRAWRWRKVRIPPVYGRHALTGRCCARNLLRMVFAVTLNADAVKVAGLNLSRKWVKIIARSSHWVVALGLPGLGPLPHPAAFLLLDLSLLLINVVLWKLSNLEVNNNKLLLNTCIVPYIIVNLTSFSMHWVHVQKVNFYA